MAFENVTPESALKLKEYLNKLAENKGHVKGVKVNATTNMLQVDLDWAANFAGYPDVQLPIKKGKHEQAKRVLDHLVRDISAGLPPSDTDAMQLFDLIDQTPR